MSARETILAAITAALAGASGVGGRVYRSRVLALGKGKLPAVVVRPLSESVTEPTLGGADRLLSFAVEIHTRGDGADVLADPIAASAHGLIMADPSVGGLAIDLGEIGSEWSQDDADGEAGILTITYSVLYRTARNAT